MRPVAVAGVCASRRRVVLAVVAACLSLGLLAACLSVDGFSSPVVGAVDGAQSDADEATDAREVETAAPEDASRDASIRASRFALIRGDASASFRIQEEEVTIADYNAFLATNTKANVGACAAEREYLTPIAGDPEAPAAGVPYCGAKLYCLAVGARLCQVGEWVYGCGAGAPSPWKSELYTGNPSTSPQSLHCQYASDAARPNAAGYCSGGRMGGVDPGFNTFDMAGNVAEWIDCEEGDSLPAMCSARGGSFADPYDVDAAACGKTMAFEPKKMTRTVGFRCCREP